jgi:hypothetical protein
MILIKMKLRESGEEVQIGEGGRLTEHSLRNLFVEFHMHRGDEPGGEPIRYRTEDGESGAVDPTNIEELRIFRDDEDITADIVADKD